MPLLLHFHDLMRERRIPFAEARIYMVVPEIPMTEGDEILKIGEQMVFGVQPLSADQTPRGEVCIRPFAASVRDDIVHAVVMPFEVVQPSSSSSKVGASCRHQLSPSVRKARSMLVAPPKVKKVLPPIVYTCPRIR